jgi:hypothetical protein
MVCEDTNHGWGPLASMVCVSTKHAYSNIILYRPKITVHRWFVRTQTTGGTRPKTPLIKPLQQGLYIFITFRGTA